MIVAIDLHPLNPTAINITCLTAPPSGGALSWLADKLAPPLTTGIVVSIIATVIIGRAMERFRARRDHVNKSVDALRTQLASIQKLGAEYWGDNLEKSKSVSLEAEIEFTLRDISSLVKVSAPDLWSAPDDSGPDLMVDLLAAVTGEGFGADDHKPDLSKVRDISMRAAELSGRLAADRQRYLVTSAWWEGGILTKQRTRRRHI